MNYKAFVIAAATFAIAHANGEDFPLKKHSTFANRDAAHNPFWPIGWTKTAVNATAASPAGLLKADDFTVTSILLNNPPLAVVNGKAMEEGEVIAMDVQGRAIYIQLAAVRDGEVVLRYGEQNVTVSLRRKGEEPRTALR